MADIGDRVQVSSPKLGQPVRDGVVTGVNGKLLQVRWSSGAESTVAPAAGSLAVVGKVKATSKQERPTKTKVSKAKRSNRNINKAIYQD